MKKKLTHNIGLKILSVIVAFLLWLVVVSVDDPVTSRPFTQIKVEMTNTSAITNQDKVFEVLEGTDVIGITVTAKRSVLDTLSRDNFKATADMSKLEGNAVPIEVKATRYADRIDDISLKTKNVLVNIEGLQETQFNIQVATQGAIAEGCVVGNITLDKNVVKVSGPQSIVETIKSAQVVVNVSGMTNNISTSESIQLLNENGDLVDTSDLTLSRDTVNIQVEIWPSKEVPVIYGYIGEAAPGFGATGEMSCSLPVIKVAGEKSALEAVSSVTVASSAVDIQGAVSDVEKSIDVSKYLPKGIVLASPETDTNIVIRVGIQPLQTKTVEVPTSNITAINVPEGMNATIGGIGDVVAVEIRGLGNAFNNLDPTQITGVVDVDQISSNTEAGVLSEDIYDATVTFNYPAGIYAGTNEVKVKLILKNGDSVQNNEE